jgi:uncharacterized damage-inducible protein DinB
MSDDLAGILTTYSASKLRQLAGRIKTCLDRLDEDQIWARGGDNANAVGNLCLHLAGNLRQWIGHGVAAMPDIRTRDLEFAARGGTPKDELWRRLSATAEETAAIIEKLTAQDLRRMTRVQKYDITVMEAVLHVVEHFSQHTGQILFATKAFTGEDLGFYTHLAKREPQPAPPGQTTP